MIREYEFRGKYKYADEWVFGNLIEDNHPNMAKVFIHCNSIEDIWRTYSVEVKPETVGQLWATINNKNGVKIFEGDIISFGSSLVCVIIYNEVNKCFSSIEKSEYNRLQFCDELSRLNILANLGYAKVEFISALLGNIFDNPDLLK